MAEQDTKAMFPNLSVESVVEGRKLLSDVIAKYYGDPDYKARLDADPTGVLKSEGLPVPEGTSVKLVVSTAEELNIVFPWVDPE